MVLARSCRATLALMLLMSIGLPARAGVIVPFTDLSASAADVTLRDGSTAKMGYSTGYLDTTPANIHSGFTDLDKFNGSPTLGEENFAVAFTNWNNANGGNWKLIDGGDLDIRFLVLESAFINKDKTGGGVTMNIITGDYKPAANGPTLAQFGWTQAVIANFQPGVDGVSNPPIVTLDTFTTENRKGKPTPIPPGPDAKNNTTPSDLPENKAPGYADPLYPFLIKDVAKSVLGMGDEPTGLFPDASFRAIALLSTVTLKTDADGKIIERDLTVYQGVSWGFDLRVVPEPSSAALLVLGVLSVATVTRIRHRRAAA
jgi:hypothetical protein